MNVSSSLQRCIAFLLGVFFVGGATAGYAFPAFNLPVTSTTGWMQLDVSAIPMQVFLGYRVTVNWQPALGDPFQNEAFWALTDRAGSDPDARWYADPGWAANAFASSAPRTLTWVGFLETPYVGGEDLWLGYRQSYPDSVAVWGDVSITLLGANEDPPASQDIDVGDTLSGSLLAPGQVDWYHLSLNEAASVDINTLLSPSAAVGGVGDTVIAVYDHNGLLVATNDDADFVNREFLSRINETLPAGEYYISVAGAYGAYVTEGYWGAIGGDMTGAYTLQITPEPASAALLAFGLLPLTRRRR